MMGGSGPAGASSEEMNASGKWAGKQHGENLKLGPVKMAYTLGFRPTCDCESSSIPCTVLDPFLGSGTTALTALRLGRDAVGVELNPEYAQMAAERLWTELPEAELEFPEPKSLESS